MQTNYSPIGGQPLSIENVFAEEESEQAPPTSVLHLLSRPSDLPSNEAQKTIELAERVLARALQCRDLGHHATVRREIQDWAAQFKEDDEQQAVFEGAFNLTPQEIARYTLSRKNGSRERKATAVLAWAEQYDEPLVAEAKAALRRDARKKWEDAIEQARTRAEAASIVRHPPDEIDSWSRIESPGPAVRLAYEHTGVRDRVVVLYETDIALAAEEFRQEDWNATGGDPRTARTNRPIAPSKDGAELYVRLMEYLRNN